MAKRILIVDDAVFMRMKLKDILEKNGYEVAGEAQNGQEAFDKYQAEKPDLVTMDITMPEVDGLQALKMIKQAVDFIVKPFDTERVIQSLDKALS